MDYRKPQKNKKSEANAVETEGDDQFLVAVVSEVNLVDSNPKEWWLDTGATHHVFSDKNAFCSLDMRPIGEKLSWETWPPPMSWGRATSSSK